MARKVDSRFVWLDGKVLDADAAKVSFFSHALHYGTAVFEGIRCYEGDQGPAIFRLPEHLERLRRSAEAYFMSYNWTDAQLTDGIKDLIRQHNFKECYIRPLVMTGEGAMGVRPRDCEINVAMTVWSWGSYLGPGALENGIRATLSPIRKFSTSALDPTIKASGHYLNSVRAVMDAHRRGFTEALLLNQEGRVAEGPGENFFLVKNNRVITNPPEECLLLGVTRDSVLTIVKDLGIEIEIRPIALAEVKDADEAFYTGTAAEVTPIASLDDQPIGAGRRGPVTEKIQTTYLNAVRGRVPAYQSWLTPVP